MAIGTNRSGPQEDNKVYGEKGEGGERERTPSA